MTQWPSPNQHVLVCANRCVAHPNNASTHHSSLSYPQVHCILRRVPTARWPHWSQSTAHLGPIVHLAAHLPRCARQAALGQVEAWGARENVPNAQEGTRALPAALLHHHALLACTQIAQARAHANVAQEASFRMKRVPLSASLARAGLTAQRVRLHRCRALEAPTLLGST